MTSITTSQLAAETTGDALQAALTLADHIRTLNAQLPPLEPPASAVLASAVVAANNAARLARLAREQQLDHVAHEAGLR